MNDYQLIQSVVVIESEFLISTAQSVKEFTTDSRSPDLIFDALKFGIKTLKDARKEAHESYPEIFRVINRV